jgi:hypothetical protein
MIEDIIHLISYRKGGHRKGKKGDQRKEVKPTVGLSA